MGDRALASCLLWMCLFWLAAVGIVVALMRGIGA